MPGVWAFVKLSRPHFLLGGALLYALGAFSVGAMSLTAYILGQVMVSAIQLSAHYANEYADLESDAQVTNRTLFSGGSGVLSAGVLRPEVALRSARVASVVAIVCLGIIVQISVVAAAIGLIALTVSWGYSMPPTRLLNSGYGELLTSIVVTVLVPAVAVLVQAETPPPPLYWAMAALVPAHVVMMLAFELPDLDADAESGKTVLAVRLGRARTHTTIHWLSMAPTAVSAVAVLLGGQLTQMLIPPAAALIPIAGLWWSLRSERHHSMTAAGVGQLVVLAAGFLLVLAT